jgi:hypothetical protein
MRLRLQRINILGAGLEVKNTKKSQVQGTAGVAIDDIMYAGGLRSGRQRGFEGMGNDSGYE